MTIPRARKIVVENRPFRWSLPAKKPFFRWDHEGPKSNSATLTVEADQPKPGRVAQATLFWLDGHAVKPEAIAIVIRKMLDSGWNPDEKGTPFKYEDVDVDKLETKDTILRDVMDA